MRKRGGVGDDVGMSVLNASGPVQPSLLPEDPQDLLQMAAAAALRGRDGHYDELRGALNPLPRTQGLAPLWQQFLAANGAAGWQDLPARSAQLHRRLQEDGASYNLHSNAAAHGERLWPLELLPMLVDAGEWAQIERGVAQRARLLNATLADVYGERRLLDAGLLPPSLVLAHPQYLRPMHGCVPPGGVHLHVVAMDLARCPDGLWWLVGQRTQSPAGLGYVLENRMLVAQQFPEAFRTLRVQRLAASYQRLLRGLTRLLPEAEREGARVALLTPGPRDDTYFEHAFLARYLGISLVEGGDLTVRGDRVFLKTLRGLERVHVLLRRVDDDALDPLELRPDSTQGVPGLLQALRAGQVVLANAPGAGWLESPGLTAFWPGVAEELLGEELLLPAATAWWCGEEAVWRERLDELEQYVVSPTFPPSATTPDFAPVAVKGLSAPARAQLLERIAADPGAYTLQTRQRPSETPVWRHGQLEPRAAVLRVFAIADGDGGWSVLPGGLTRVASGREGSDHAWVSMRRGSASVDTWVRTEGEVDNTSLLPKPLTAADLTGSHWTVTSRAAENLFWLGRYSERAENTVRLAQLTLETLGAAARGEVGGEGVLGLLDTLARQHGLVGEAVPSAEQAPRVFERALVHALGDAFGAYSVGFNLQALQNCAASLRERLSAEHWKLIHEAGDQFRLRLQPVLEGAGTEARRHVLDTLSRVATQLAAITGAQTDRMTRDDGWRLLSVGRQIERLDFLAGALALAFEHGVQHSEEGFALLLGLFDSTMTYRAKFQARREVPPLLHLLVHDTDNPRSLAWVARTMVGRFVKLSRHDPEWTARVAASLPEPESWPLASLCTPDAEGRYGELVALLQGCSEQAQALSVELDRRLFAHVGSADRMVWQ